jgi:hypothetical protein
VIMPLCAMLLRLRHNGAQKRKSNATAFFIYW